MPMGRFPILLLAATLAWLVATPYGQAERRAEEMTARLAESFELAQAGSESSGRNPQRDNAAQDSPDHKASFPPRRRTLPIRWTSPFSGTGRICGCANRSA